MNKLLTKVAKLVLGLSLATGVGVAIGRKSAQRVDAAEITDVITASDLAATGTSYTAFSGVSLSSNAVYAGSSALNNNTNIQIRSSSSNTGIFTTASGGTLKSVKITVASGSNTIQVFGKNSAYTSISDLYSNNASTKGTLVGSTSSTGTITAGDSYTYIGIRSSSGACYISSIEVTWTTGSGAAAYTSVTVSEKTALVGTYKTDAYYECAATVAGTGNYSSSVTWSITSSNTYGSGTTIANKASIDSNGKITFLDNCTVYVWATAADGSTHNTTGFAVAVSTLKDNPINSWTKVTSTSDVSSTKVYSLSNDKTNFAGNAVSNSQLALTTSLSSIGYFVLEQTSGGYHLSFATCTADVWSSSSSYVNNSSSTGLSGTNTGSSVWTVASYSGGVILRNASNSNRFLGLTGSGGIKAYASGNEESYPPVYLYEAGSLPEISCAVIELTGKPSGDLDIGDHVTLGYTAYDSELNDWTGDVVYSISNEKDANNNTTTGVVSLSATSGASVTLTALKAGSARVSVQDADQNANADYFDVTVLADPERIDLPAGTYTVSLSVSGSGATVGPTSSHEIKAKEGRTWYKNLVLNYTDVENSYSNEFTMAKSTGIISSTNNSNAIITSIEVDYFGYENATMYVGSTPISSTPGTNSENASSLMKVYSINAQNFALKNENASHAQSFYSLKIHFEVVDENEEILSVVVSKGAGWNKTAYKTGDSPSNEGLVVTANYTTDGSTISRSADVTSSIATSDWAFTPSTLSKGDTYFDVVATFDNVDSASFRVTGITVTDIEGPIESGRYYIMDSTKSYGLNAVAASESSPSALDLSADENALTAFDVVLKADNEYEISVTISGTKYYLVCNTTSTSGSNTSIRVTSSPSNSLKSKYWSLDNTDVETDGAYNVSENTTGSTNRYLAYVTASSDWRGYVNTNNGDPEIQFVKEGSYAQSIADMLNDNVTCNNGTTAPTTSSWSTVSTAYGSVTIAYEQNLLKNAAFTVTGSGNETVVTATGTTSQSIAEAIAKYDYIVGKYNKGQGLTAYNDFLERDPDRIGGARLVLSNIVSENTNTIAIIVIISLVSVTAIGGYFFIKRREQN